MSAPCPHCDGTGFDRAMFDDPCEPCAGEGTDPEAPMTDIKETIERLEGLAEKATTDSGWFMGINDGAIYAQDIDDDSSWSIIVAESVDPNNAAFITELVNAFPTLITAIKELEGERDRLRALLKPFADEGANWVNCSLPHTTCPLMGHPQDIYSDGDEVEGAEDTVFSIADLLAAHKEMKP